jgi:hypothetical protein
MLKKKYIRLINSSFLIFESKKKNKINGNDEKKFGNILNSINPTLKYLKNMMARKNQLIELEFTTLFSFQPNIEVNFFSDINYEEDGFSNSLKIFLSKKFTIFCSRSLPLFKYTSVKQGETLKIEIKLNKIQESDRIFSEIYLEKEKYLKSEIFLKNRKKNFSTEIRYNFIINGFLKFRNSSYYPIDHVPFYGFLKNRGLILYNKGPEFRFNSRDEN